jgi:hypothetical protein
MAAPSAGGSAPKAFSPLAVAANAQTLNRARGVVASLTGLAIGVVGITGAAGFGAYLLLQLVLALAVLSRMGWQPASYVPGSSIVSFLSSGAGDNVMVFLFCWTLAYALVHIY